MLYVDRVKLDQRPKMFKSPKVRALKKSPSRVAEAKALSRVPKPYRWEDLRADARELMLNGLTFWDAVAEVRKRQMLHDQFSKRALVGMMVSAFYWEGLDRTPWTSYVPGSYYEAALKQILDPALDHVPESWGSLPVHPRPGSPPSQDDSIFKFLSSNSLDDPKTDKTFQGKAARGPSAVQTRRQQPSSGGKRSRGSAGSCSGSGKAAKAAKDSGQSSAGQTSRAKLNIPEPPEDDGIIERPQRGSWFHYGIKVQELLQQTFGFPRYMSVKSMMKHLHLRWRALDYWRLLLTSPWDEMWKGRVRSLVFFQYGDMQPGMVQALTVIANFMSRWRREYWERLHWVTMDPSHDYQASAEMRGIPGLAEMYRDRKERGSEFDAKRKELMTSLETIDGYNEKIWYEPGLWVVPRDPCYWITRDPKLGFSLSSQLATVDDLECARTQWATRRTDNAFMNLAPDELVNKFLSDEERTENPIKPDPAFKHDRLEYVLAAIR